MNIAKLSLFIATAIAAVSLVAAPGMTATKTSDKITIDGKLDEPAWKCASTQNNFVYPQSRKGQPGAQTEFKVLADADAVYFGIICREPLMDKLSARQTQRNGAVYLDDCIEIFFDPAGRRVNYYHFSVSAGNIQAAEYIIEGGNTSGGYFDPFWESAIYKGQDFWSAEIRIPYRALYRTPAAEFSLDWVLNIGRERCPVSEISTWAQVDNGFHAVKLYGSMKDMPLKKASDDVAASALEFSNIGAAAGRYTGNLQVQIQVDKAAAGKYRLALSSDKLEPYSSVIELKSGLNKIALPGMKIKSLGGITVELKLTRDADGRDFGTYLKSNLAWTPMTVSFKQPFYGKSFFPDQKSDKICGSVAINMPDNAGTKRILRLSASGAGAEQNSELGADKSPVMFELDSSGMTAGGTVSLTFELLESGREIARDTVAVRKLAETGHTIVRIDEFQRLVVNGKPLFLIGWYGGGGYMVAPPFLDKYPTPQAKCAAVNMPGEWINLEPERLCPDFKAEMHKDVKPSQKVFDAVKKKIDANREKDFWLYYLCDEPECRGISPVYLKYLYDYIKEQDPYHPVMIISRDPVESVKACDIINPHPYLAPRFTPDFKRQVYSVTKEQAMWKLTGPLVKNQPKAFMMCPQTFTYSFMDRYAANPLFEELNPMFWSGVAHGATGITPFIYCAYPATPDMELGIEFLFESMSALSDLIISPVAPLALNVNSSPGNVDVMAKQHNGNLLLIVVNPENIPAVVSISGKELAEFKELYNFREAGVTKIHGGKLELKLSPMEVKIFTAQKMDDKLITLEQLKQNIAAKEKALAKPGNILYQRGREMEFASNKSSSSTSSIQDTITNGVTDMYSWLETPGGKGIPFFEMQFPSFVPKFSRIVVYGQNLDGTSVKIWKAGEWKTLTPVDVKSGKYLLDYTFDKSYSTVKVRLEMPKTGGKGAIYEVEMY